MKRMVEVAAFLGLATAVHAGVWVGLSGAPAGGDGDGAGPLVFEGGGAEAAALVRRWEALPEAELDAPAPRLDTRAETPAAPMADIVALPGPSPRPPAPVAPAADAPPDHSAMLAPEPPPPLARPRDPAPETVRPRPRPEPAPPEARAPQAQPSAGASARASRPPSGGDGSRASAAQARALQAEWGAAILSRIARQQRYPGGARGSGTVRVTVTVGRDGRLGGVSLAASSGTPAFDRAALDAVRRAGRFPAAPSALTRASYSFSVPMTFRHN